MVKIWQPAIDPEFHWYLTAITAGIKVANNPNTKKSPYSRASFLVHAGDGGSIPQPDESANMLKQMAAGSVKYISQSAGIGLTEGPRSKCGPAK